MTERPAEIRRAIWTAWIIATISVTAKWVFVWLISFGQVGGWFMWLVAANIVPAIVVTVFSLIQRPYGRYLAIAGYVWLALFTDPILMQGFWAAITHFPELLSSGSALIILMVKLALACGCAVAALALSRTDVAAWYSRTSA